MSSNLLSFDEPETWPHETDVSIAELVNSRNRSKILFTPGPAALLKENLDGLRPCFGRGDADYLAVEDRVLERLRAIAGQDRIVRMQGSATLALEIGIRNFVRGRVLVVHSGYYSDRLLEMTRSCCKPAGAVEELATVLWSELDRVDRRFDWIIACYTETSNGTLVPIDSLRKAARNAGSRLMLDATASIGLEEGHEAADLVAFSSCKGLFGLTGASFIAYNDLPSNDVVSFYLNINTHVSKSVTGPYHAICSLDRVLPIHSDLRYSVTENKNVFMATYGEWIPLPKSNQPKLCTKINAHVTHADPRAVLYVPRGKGVGSVVCHLGEVHLGERAKGAILEALKVAPLLP